MDDNERGIVVEIPDEDYYGLREPDWEAARKQWREAGRKIAQERDRRVNKIILDCIEGKGRIR